MYGNFPVHNTKVIDLRIQKKFLGWEGGGGAMQLQTRGDPINVTINVRLFCAFIVR